MFALSEFDIRYQPAKAVKGQALADLVADRIGTDVAALFIRAWAMFFDGSACDDGCGVGILLVSPRGATYSFSIRMTAPCTNNLVEYEAVRKGMELLLEAGAEAVEIFGDSKLVISQLTEEYRCESEALFSIWMQCRELRNHQLRISKYFHRFCSSFEEQFHPLANGFIFHQIIGAYGSHPDGERVSRPSRRHQ